MFNFKPVSRRVQRNAEKGQSLVEMTFGLVVLLMIVAGVLDLGRAYFSIVALEDAAGEAAIYVSAFPDCPYDGEGAAVSDDGIEDSDVTDGIDCDPPNNAQWRAENAGGPTGLVNFQNDATFTIQCFDNTDVDLLTPLDCRTDGYNKDKVRVIIDYEFDLLSPFIPETANGATSLNLRGLATETITAPRIDPTP